MVLVAARTLITEVGLSGINYTSVAERSGVTRQTLYRHWPHREDLLREIQLEGPDDHLRRNLRDDIRTTLLDTLRRYANLIGSPNDARRILALMTSADLDQAAGTELSELVEGARDDLNRRLLPTGLSIDSASFSQLLGPVTSRRFLNRGPITEEFLELTADRFISVTTTSEARVRDPGRPAAKV